MHIEVMSAPLMRAAVMATVILGLAAPVIQTQAQPTNPTGKRRRVLINDDGEVRQPGPGQTLEDYLNVRFSATANTQVDTYFLCVGATDRGPGSGPPSYPQDGKAAPKIQDTQNQWALGVLPHPDIDRLTLAYLKATRQAGMEIFASFRMNDIHDAWTHKVVGTRQIATPLTYPLKAQRPDLLLGKDYQPAGYPNLLADEGTDPPYRYPGGTIMRGFWSGLDYGKDEVRQHFLDFIISYCRHYDFDGVELDFGRHPMYFKFGQVDQNVEKMSEFVRQIRRGLNEIGRQRSKPYLLTARVPDSPKIAMAIGLNVQQWLEDHLLDMLMVGTGYMPSSGRLKQLIDMAHRYDIPAYPCIDYFHDPTNMRSWASNLWALGGDGIYLFNWYGHEYYVKEYGRDKADERLACFHQFGDPDLLLGLDKIYVPDNGNSIFYRGRTNAIGRFPTKPFNEFRRSHYGVEHRIHPVWLAEGTPIELMVGDDLKKAERMGLLKDLRLLVNVSHMDNHEGIVIKINGVRVPDQNIKRVHSDLFDATISHAFFKRGLNEVIVLHGPNSIGRLKSTVTDLKLFVRYVKK